VSALFKFRIRPSNESGGYVRGWDSSVGYSLQSLIVIVKRWDKWVYFPFKIRSS